MVFDDDSSDDPDPAQRCRSVAQPTSESIERYRRPCRRCVVWAGVRVDGRSGSTVTRHGISTRILNAPPLSGRTNTADRGRVVVVVDRDHRGRAGHEIAGRSPSRTRRCGNCPRRLRRSTARALLRACSARAILMSSLASRSGGHRGIYPATAAGDSPMGASQAQRARILAAPQRPGSMPRKYAST